MHPSSLAILLISIPVLIKSQCEISAQPKVFHDCPNHMWRKFRRANGYTVCLNSMDAIVDYKDALHLCHSFDAELFGIESPDEFEYVKEKHAGLTVLIGAQRRNECNNKKQTLESNPNCTYSKMFQFTDGITSSDYLWNDKWLGGGPDSLFINDEYEQSIFIHNGKIADVNSKEIRTAALCGVVLTS